MSNRYRLYPTPAQEAVLREYCGHARYVWNLAVEQQSWWRAGRKSAPGWAEQSRQLTEARAASTWLAAGSHMVQQQALRDFATAMGYFFDGTRGKPTWRKEGRSEGFQVVGQIGQKWDVRRLSRNVGEVRIPKFEWVRFRWTRAVPSGAKSYRVTLDRAGRWHVSFLAIPPAIAGPGTGEVAGVDLGVTVSATLSTGEMMRCPKPGPPEHARMARLQRKLARSVPDSNRRERARLSYARLHARQRNRRKDWAEKTSTDLARRFDVIRIEDLRIERMTRSARGTVANPGRNVSQKAGLNREVRTSGWGLMVRRLEQKARGRVERVPAAYTSLTCNACGHCAPGNRKSQAVFVCVACGHADHADTNAAKNIARGHRVTVRGGSQLGPANREPQIAA